jgi:hypothetical protein
MPATNRAFPAFKRCKASSAFGPESGIVLMPAGSSLRSP